MPVWPMTLLILLGAALALSVLANIVLLIELARQASSGSLDSRIWPGQIIQTRG